MEEVEIRPIQEGDINFIYSTMLRGLYYAADSFYSLIEKKVFFQKYDVVLKALLNKPDTSVLIACLAAEPEIILGYALIGPGTLHYVYVKPAWRNRGIAALLCEPRGEAIRAYTHCTHTVPAIENLRNKKKLTFNPFLI